MTRNVLESAFHTASHEITLDHHFHPLVVKTFEKTLLHEKEQQCLSIFIFEND